MQIAKNLRMNTDVRRKIFYSVMSSEDYVEAYGKVLKLNLKVMYVELVVETQFKTKNL